MKKILLFTLLVSMVLIPEKSHTQTPRVDLPTEYIRNNTLGKNNIPDNVQGSPYFTDKFIYGTVYVKEDSYHADLRYNAYLDEIQMRDKGKIIALLKRDYVKAKIANQTYAIASYEYSGSSKQGYFVELNGGKAQLLLKQTKTFVEGKKSESSYGSDIPSKFVAKEAYYLKLGENPAALIKLKKKDILRHLDSKKEVEDFIAKNSLKLKEKMEIVQLLNYYNSL